MLCEVVDPACRPEGAPGICVPRRRYRPSTCRDNPYPVCGCDGKTYATDCSLRAAGVALAHTGSCELSCGGSDRVACPAGQICYATYGCDGTDAWGVCGGADDPSCAPGATPQVACACDGVTYPRACDVPAGVALKHTGACAVE